MSLNQRMIYDSKFDVSTSLQPLKDSTSEAPINFRSLSTNIGHSATASQRIVKNLNKRDFRGETHLHLCARRGDLAMCKKFVEEGADVNVADNAGWTPLHEACAYGFYEMVEFLIKNNADVNKASYDGVCPLHDAVQSQSPKLVWLLLKNGAFPSTPSADGQLPIDLNKDGIEAINELLSTSAIPDEYVERDVNLMDNPKNDEQNFAIKKEEKQPASFTVFVESVERSVAPVSANETVQSQADSTLSMFLPDNKPSLSEKTCSTAVSDSSNLSSPSKVMFSTLKKEKKDSISSASLMRKSNKLFTTSSHSSGASLVTEKGRKRGGSAASALMNNRKRVISAMPTATIVPLVDAAAIASNLSSDVYEFHSSPESADGEFDAMDGGVNGGLLLQKSASGIQYSSSGLVAYASSAPASSPQLVGPSSDLPTSSSDFMEGSASLLMTNVSFTSSIAPDDATSSTVGDTPLTAPKRIKTATLAKELLAAAANLSAEDGSGGGDGVTAAVPANASTKSDSANGVDDRADYKSSHHDISAAFNKVLTKGTDIVNSEGTTTVNDFKEMNAVDRDGLQDVLLQKKKVPPLRILLPKASSIEDSGELSPADISADQNAIDDLSTTSTSIQTNAQQLDVGAVDKSGSIFGELSAFEDNQTVIGEESGVGLSSAIVAGTARMSTRRHHHHHHRHHRTTAATTISAVTARNASEERQSLCEDEEDMPLLAAIASAAIIDSETVEKNTNVVVNDTVLVVNRQSQSRVTRSRMRQNGDGFDELANGGAGVKRKAGGTIVTRRSAAGRRAGSARPVRGAATTNSDINLDALADGEDMDVDCITADDGNSRDRADLDGGSGNVNEEGDEENVAENETIDVSINCDASGVSNSAEDDAVKAKEMAVMTLFGRNCFDASVEFHNVVRDGWRREYVAQLEQLTASSSSLAQSIDYFTAAYRRHLLKYRVLRHTKQQCQALETELNFPLPATMERLRKEHAKRRAQLSEAHRRERERLMEFAAREYCRTVFVSENRFTQLKSSGITFGGGTQQQQQPLCGASRAAMGGGNDASVMNAVRLLRDAELYDPFSVSRSALAAISAIYSSQNQSPHASISPVKLSGGVAAKSNVTSSMSANSSAERTQLMQRLKHMSTTAKNRQALEAHSLFVTQLAEWQKMVDKCYRQQQQRQQQQKQKQDEVEGEEKTTDENNKSVNVKESSKLKKLNNNNESETVVIIDESNRHLLNAVVRQIPVDEATFTFLSALTA